MKYQSPKRPPATAISAVTQISLCIRSMNAVTVMGCDCMPRSGEVPHERLPGLAARPVAGQGAVLTRSPLSGGKPSTENGSASLWRFEAVLLQDVPHRLLRSRLHVINPWVDEILGLLTKHGLLEFQKDLIAIVSG
jgi:hypothetical protein